MLEENENSREINEEDPVIDEEVERYKARVRQERMATVMDTVESPKKRKSHPWLIWTLVTALLCGACSYVTARLVSKSILENISDEKVVVYQNTGTEKTNITVETSDLSGIVSGVENTVVEVYTESVKYNTFYGEYVTSGAGSGVIISENGYIITNNHVIEDARSIRVALHNGKDYQAVLVGRDSELDIAILKIDEHDLPCAVLGDSDALKVGQTCIAIGNPLGTLGGTVTTGVISALSREITVDGNKMTLLQTDTTINPGNSGGGLFDVTGTLVGIVNAKYSSEKVEGIGFAIPINDVKEIINDLIVNGHVTGRPVIGISCTSIENERYMNYYGVSRNGVYINQVTLETASKAGLKAKDLIIRLDNYEINGFDDLESALKNYKPGDSVSITVLRNNEEMTFKVLLSERTE
ncbi:MAG: trypsin-like peptidase domain-containing protein [Erysipelotrichaceae bacterium]|nr:trypsin-like peptidase domain-containing protein [Erysipelotrichaceae bacterium]